MFIEIIIFGKKFIYIVGLIKKEMNKRKYMLLIFRVKGGILKFIDILKVRV